MRLLHHIRHSSVQVEVATCLRLVSSEHDGRQHIRAGLTKHLDSFSSVSIYDDVSSDVNVCGA